MESNNWRPAQPDPPTNNMDAGDWRSLLPPDSRNHIVNMIMETLKKHLPFTGQEGLQELKKIAVRFEEKIYTTATSQSDYQRIISLKMLTMETKSRNTIAGSLATNPTSSGGNPTEAVPQNMQPQVHNQGQSVPMPLAANQQPQGRQQMFAQNLPGNIASAGIPSSAGLNIADASHNAVGSSIGQGVATNAFTNQKQVPGRQQVQTWQQPSQQQLMYQQQLLQQFQLQQGSMPNPLMQSHIQQQQQLNALQPNQMQLLQQAGISTSNAMLQQHPQSSLASVHQSGQSMLQQHPQSALRQQQQPQQTPVLHQQQITQLSTMMSQLQTSEPQQPW